MAAVGVLGRLPEPEEFPEAAAVADRFGSLKRAFALVRRVTGGGMGSDPQAAY